MARISGGGRTGNRSSGRRGSPLVENVLPSTHAMANLDAENDPPVVDTTRLMQVMSAIKEATDRIRKEYDESLKFKVLKDFVKIGAPIYSGEIDMMVALRWIEDIEHYFTCFSIGDDSLKMVIAQFFLRGEALFWWRGLNIDSDNLTWDEFKEIFLRNYSPDPKREANSKVELKIMARRTKNLGGGPVRKAVQPAQQAEEHTAEKETFFFRVVQRMSKLGAPIFNGGIDPMEAERWMAEIELYFTALSIKDDSLKVRLVAPLMRGQALFWFQDLKANSRIKNLTWVKFKEEFLSSYFRKHDRVAKRKEFQNLSQQTMSVYEYAQRFTNLSRFAPEYVSTEEFKVERFQQGLKPNIELYMCCQQVSDFETAVRKAMAIEAVEIDTNRMRESRDYNSFRGGRKRSRHEFMSSNKMTGCFGCGDTNHKVRFCPRTQCRACGGVCHVQSDCRRPFISSSYE